MTEKTDRLKKTDKPELAEQVYRILDEFYPELIEFIDSANAYQHLIAVILSAQTTDKQVNAVLPALFTRFPVPENLMAADPAEVEEIIHSVGFFRVKARNIIAAARDIQERFHGVVPEAMEELLSIPGVGRKSAHVIRGKCFGLPAIIVDTHFGRVVRRLGLAQGKNPESVEKQIAGKISPEKQYRFSMIINLHGREFCHAGRPKCTACPLAAICPSAQNISEPVKSS